MLKQTPDDGRLPAAGVIALKPVEHASRGSPYPIRCDGALRGQWRWTLSALCRALPHVLVVSDQPLEARLRQAGIVAEVISESGHVGMNTALSRGARELRAQGFSSVLACVGDLPALRPESVLRILDASHSHPRSFVVDASGIGTTMLVAHDVELAPQFQGGRLQLTTPPAR